MRTITNTKALKPAHFSDQVWNDSLAYIKTVVDIANEPFLILNEKLCVVAANELYYTAFKVEQKDVEHKSVYELGNGQWNLASLRKRLDDIVVNESFFKGFEMTHEFPSIGRRTMMLNGRRIYRGLTPATSKLSVTPKLLFVMEDITDMITVTEKLTSHVSAFEADIADRTAKIEKSLEEMKRRFLK